MKEINIKDQKFFEDLLWMSVRYCIGRHTISSTKHANHIAEYADTMDDVFREKLAVEIRREIDRSLSFNSNIKIEYRYDDDSIDVATLIGKALAETDPEELLWKDTLFTVDKKNHEVVKSTVFDCANQKITTILCDYLPWAKLANFLDKSTWRDVVVEYDGKRETYKCFPYIQEIFSSETKYSYRINWCEVCKAHTRWDVFISPEYIKEIKEIK
jgi:hypothetical protein